MSAMGRVTLRVAALGLSAVIVLGAASCGGDNDDQAVQTTTTSVAPSPVTLTDGPGAFAVIDGVGRFTTFLGVVEQAGLSETLGVGGPWTVFAPDDAAMNALDDETREVLRTDTAAARTFVLAHVLAGVWRDVDLLTLDGLTLTSQAETTLTFAVVDGTIAILTEPEGEVVVEPLSLEAANAVVHAVGVPVWAPERNPG